MSDIGKLLSILSISFINKITLKIEKITNANAYILIVEIIFQTYFILLILFMRFIYHENYEIPAFYMLHNGFGD